MSASDIDVVKLGGSILRDDADLARGVHEIYRAVRDGRRIVAVVSAIGSTTDDLERRAARWASRDERPDLRARILATGEAVAASLLGLALHRAGVEATVLDHDLVTTRGPLLDAEPIEIDREALERALDACPVVVVPGFAGRDAATGATALLGRGGSDLTAVVIAAALGVRCALVKDVGGLYTADPNRSGGARRHATATWKRAAEIGGEVVQPAALERARRDGVPILVRGLLARTGSVIGARQTRLAPPEAAPRTVRVGILGAGTVGAGVHAALARLDDRIEIAGILVRDALAPGRDVPGHLLTADFGDILARGCDIVIEAIGGVDAALSLVERAIDAGADVVTANKELLVEHGEHLARHARACGVELRHSAGAGGGAPLLEAIERIAAVAGVRRVEGVVSGAVNAILDDLAGGAPLVDAVRTAQIRGLTEPDPGADLAGLDAARKAILCARAAFGAAPAYARVVREAVTEATAARAVEAADGGARLRQVTWCERRGNVVRAGVELAALPAAHALAAARGAMNVVRIVDANGGATIVRGAGAGRWPTTEAVVADVLDLAAARCRTAAREVPA